MNPESTPQVTDKEDTAIDSRSQLRAILTCIGIGVGALLGAGVWMAPGYILLYLIQGEVTSQAGILIETISLLFGAASIYYIYLKWGNKYDDSIEIEIPNRKTVAIVIGGIISLILMGFAIEQVTQLFGITSSDHGIYKLATAEGSEIPPAFFLLMAGLSIVVVGPAEELIYRGVIQKYLYNIFTRKRAIAITSVIFSLVHIPAYLTGEVGSVIVALVSVLFLSVVLGGIYSYTENLAAPVLIHGFYNAILFVLLYIELAGLI